jgi:tyrosyl-tRNA synthetase
MFPAIDEQMALLERGCERIYVPDELRSRLEQARQAGRQLRVKLGMDPTAPDIHLGHSVVLRKLRHFQDIGHRAVLIIGDYTAMVGDPSGRSKTRPMLSPEDVKRNAETYLAQAGKILLTTPDRLEVRYNSEWLSGLTFADVLRLTSQMTVARMLERDTFAKRYKEGTEIYIHEFLYPLMQGRDSVEIRADVELGGTDQTFNNLVGRDLQRDAGQPPQIVVIMPILVGLDGKEKMSKSLGNAVGVLDPAGDMFGKLMSIPDEVMRNYFELLTTRPREEVDVLVDAARTHPRQAKVTLCKEVVSGYHGEGAAEAAAREFDRIHSGHGESGLPDEIPEQQVPRAWFDGEGVPLVQLIVSSGFAPSNSEAKKLVAEGGVRLNGEKLEDSRATVRLSAGDVLQRGKRRFVRLVAE